MNGTPAVLSGVFADRYVIERELGHGGTAIVYLARDRQRGHAVAIKVLRPELAQSVGADRFLDEIHVSQRLHHPHILPVLDSGNADGQLYFVTPLMEGGTLRQRLQTDMQLPLDEAIAVMRTIAVALGHAHAQGLVHRDVKPENILFTSGQACLGDFGIARALERALDATTTSTSIVRGTPPYMSPEQASGEKNYDGRSDVYSLGCVFYEMIAGIQPFVGPTPQSVIAQRLTHPPRPIRVYRPSIPVAVEAVVSRVLAVSPADRYQTALEFVEALEAAARAPAEVVSGAVAPAPHNRVRRVAIGLVATVIVVVAARLLTLPSDDPGAIVEGDPRRVAVLYLDDLTPAELPTHVADGLTEDLIDRLGGVRSLHVTSPNGVRPFRGSAVPVDSIGRVLKVGTIVSGSVARSGNTLRLNVRLVNARNGQQLYSHAVDAPWTDLFALQDSLANQVAFFLRQRIGEEIALREKRRETRSVAAWELAQRANTEVRQALAAGMRGDGQTLLVFARADSLFARAEQLDAGWIYPKVKRGLVALSLSANQPAHPPAGIDSAEYSRMRAGERRVQWIRRAVVLANAAVRQAPASAEALSLRGDALYRLLAAGAAADSEAIQAEKDLRRAVELRPDAAEAWSTLAQLWYSQGRFEEAADAAQRAFDADAFFETPRTLSVALNASLYAEQFGQARRWCRMGLSYYKGDVRFTDCELTLLGWTGRSRSEVANAWKSLDDIERASGSGMTGLTWAYRRLMVAAVLARSGLRDSAQRVLAAVEEREGRDPAQRSSLIGEAHVLLLLGDRDAALGRLELYLRNAAVARAHVRKHPWFRTLATDKRFQALVQPAR